MLIVRDIFTAKPGQASKLAKVFKKVFGNDPSVRIMTDLVSDFNTVIMEHEVSSISDYEKLLEHYRSGKPAPHMAPDAFEVMKGYTDMYISGRRDILQIID
jgi:hypothetical protein